MDFNLPQPPPPKTNWFSSHHFLAYIFVISAIGAIVSVLYYRQVANQYIDTTPITHKDSTANWQTYTNDQYGFEFKYPANSSFDLSNGYLRIENYIAQDDFSNLGPGEYYLEMNLPPSKTTCADLIVDGNKLEFTNYSVYKGYGIEGGDAGGIRYAICAEKNLNFIYLQVTENDSQGLLANQILSTFKFTETASTTQTGTLKGHVTIGPFCPVEQADNPCPGPSDAYTSREIIVYAQDKKTEVIKNFLDANGNYSFNIPAGTYWVLITPGGMQDEPLHEVTITASQITTLDFNLDTGIR